MLRDPAFFRRPNNIASRGRGGGKNRSVTKFRKNAPKYAIFSTVLSKIVGTRGFSRVWRKFSVLAEGRHIFGRKPKPRNRARKVSGTQGNRLRLSWKMPVYFVYVYSQTSANRQLRSRNRTPNLQSRIFHHWNILLLSSCTNQEPHNGTLVWE